MAHHLVKKEKAFDLFVRGATLREIADGIQVSIATIQRWKKKDDWETRDAEIGLDLRRKLDRKRVNFKLSAYKKLEPLTDNALDYYFQFTQFAGFLVAGVVVAAREREGTPG